METYTQWIFDCPVHGWEAELVCFRASDRSLISNWKKYKITYEECEYELAEKEAIFDKWRGIKASRQ